MVKIYTKKKGDVFISKVPKIKKKNKRMRKNIRYIHVCLDLGYKRKNSVRKMKRIKKSK